MSDLLGQKTPKGIPLKLGTDFFQLGPSENPNIEKLETPSLRKKSFITKKELPARKTLFPSQEFL